MPVDDVLALLFLAVLYQVPVLVAAMACAWLVHEGSLHGWTRLRGGALASRTFWTRTLWDHPSRFFPSYFLLFLAFLNLFELPFLYLPNLRGSTPAATLSALAWVFGWTGGLFVLGIAALRVRLRSAMA